MLDRAFQTLGRSFEALRENQKLCREFEKLGRVFVLQHDLCCPNQPWYFQYRLVEFKCLKQFLSLTFLEVNNGGM